MIPMKAQTVVEATGGELVRGDREQYISNISIDSRNIKAGDLFVPLLGERHEGHRFLKQALSNGAAGSFFSPALYPEENLPPGNNLFIKVADTLRALQDLARFYRKKFPTKVIAVTGSTGKTTTKDFLHAVISQSYLTLKNEGNLNNHIGVPLTLLRLNHQYKAAVVEMGMRAPGEISFLSFLARPELAIISNIGESHLGTLESKERIARAKGELIYWLDAGGIALLNGDDPYCRQLSHLTRAQTFFFGFSEGCHFQAQKEIQKSGNSTTFTAVFPDGRKDSFTVPLPGRHHVYNALAAIAAAILLQVAPREIRKGLAKAPVTSMRTEIVYSDYGLKIISDVYNASPSSMKAALEVLTSFKARPLVAVLGDMLELGSDSPRYHQEIGAEFAASGLDYLVFTGHFREEYRKGALSQGMSPEKIYCCQDLTEVYHVLPGIVSPGAALLVKGSRALMLEHVVEYLVQFQG